MKLLGQAMIILAVALLVSAIWSIGSGPDLPWQFAGTALVALFVGAAILGSKSRANK
jgi:hypothetical protein